MPKRLEIIFRALSIISSVEAILGLYLTGTAIHVFPIVRTTLENRLVHPYPNLALVMYLMSLANVAFDVLLAIASVFLWKLQRKGLFLVTCTLLAEVVYFTIAEGIKPLGLVGGNRSPLQEAIGAMMGVGNMSLGVQLITAYPVVAGVLIFFAYRYLGIPARPLN